MADDFKWMEKPEDDDLPFEVRMKYIIKAYREDKKRMESLIAHTRLLEKKLSEQNKELEKYRKIIGNSENLLKQIEDLKNVNRSLKENIEKNYPKRMIKIDEYKRIITSQNWYIKNIQKILDDNGISYHPKEAINDLEIELNNPDEL